MKSVLVAYGAAEGQIGRIAEFIADALRARGVKVDLVDSAAGGTDQIQPVYAGAIVCGSTRRHRYPASLLRFVKQNRDWLAGLPAAFVCVSHAVLPESGARGEVRRAIEEAFYRPTGWSPAFAHHIADASPAPASSRFIPWFWRRAPKPGTGKAGTPGDQELWDSAGLTRFVDGFLAATSLEERGHAAT